MTRLLDAFEEQVRNLRDLGPLRKAWFTTFSLNVGFLEGYILPILAGEERPKAAIEFDNLQAALFPIDGPSLDLKIFHDVRALNRDSLKRTSVPLHGVDFRIAHLDPSEECFRPGFFHPKVIYLEGAGGAILGAGSANLTVDGWARNRECFHFEVLRGRENRNEVRRLFQRIHAWCGLSAEFSMPIGPRNEPSPRKWRFNTSLSNELFTDLLMRTGQDRHLSVWTPYLAKNPPALAEALEHRHGLESLCLVPSLHQGRWVMMKPEHAQAFLAPRAGRDLLIEREFDHANRFSHAKVWLTADNLAIGSWNFTQSAVGLNPQRRNVEAGFVLSGNGGNRPRGLKRLDDPFDGTCDAQVLESETVAWESSMSPPEVPLVLSFDWSTRTWAWSLPVAESWMKLHPELLLPTGAGLTTPVDLKQVPKGELVAHVHGFHLRERTVDVRIIKEGRVKTLPVWILERNPEERPLAVYDSWESMIAGLMDRNPERPDKGLKNPGEGAQDLDSDLALEDSGKGDPAESVSYFRLFAAMAGARKRLQDSENPRTLRRRLFSEPGCLSEIFEAGTKRLTQKLDPSHVFQWFLAQELRSLLKVARKRWKELAPDTPSQGLDDLHSRRPPLPSLGSGTSIKGDLERVRKLAGYL
jgi:hypothetical protein